MNISDLETGGNAFEDDKIDALKKASSKSSKSCCAAPGLFGLGTVGLWTAGVVTAAVTAATLSAVLLLPQTVSCHDESYYVVPVDPPKMETTNPPFVCNYYAEKEVTFGGSGFLKYNSELPAVSVDGTSVAFENGLGAKEVDVRGQDVSTYTGFTVRVPMSRNYTGVYNSTVFMTNFQPTAPHPAAAVSSETCEHQTIGELVIVPPPIVNDITPPVICLGTTHVLTLSGSHFVWHKEVNLTVEKDVFFPEQKPNISSTGDSELLYMPSNQITMKACAALTSSASNALDMSLEHCEAVDLSVSSNVHGIGLHEVALTNPPPADCITPEPREFRIVNPPVLTSVSPPIISLSTGTGKDVVFTGTDFLRVDGVSPTVKVDGVGATVNDVDFETEDGCVAAPVKGHKVHLCTQLRVRIPPKISNAEYFPVIEITSPFLSDCAPTFTNQVLVVPPIVVDDVVPPFAMRSENSTFTVSGDHFYTATESGSSASLSPTVALNGQNLATAVATDCTDVIGPTFGTVQKCKSLVLNIFEKMLTLGSAQNDVEVVNPFDATALTQTLQVFVAEDPVLNSISPAILCLEDEDKNVVSNIDNVYKVGDNLPTLHFALPENDGKLTEITTYSPECSDLVFTSANDKHKVYKCDVGSTMDMPTYKGVLNTAKVSFVLKFNGNINVVPALSVGDGLTVVSPPTILSTRFPALCKVESDTQNLVYGGRFLKYKGKTAVFSISGKVEISPQQAALNSCKKITDDLEECTEAVLSFQYDSTKWKETGNVLSVTNPSPVDCSVTLSSPEDHLIIIDPPQVDKVLEGVDVCLDASVPQPVKVQGRFVKYGQFLPTVRVSGVEAESVEFSSGCTNKVIGSITVQECTDLSFSVPVPLPKTLGYLDLDVQMTCGAKTAPLLVGFTSPEIKDVLTSPTTDPRAICVEEQSNPFTLIGTDFQKFADGLINFSPILRANGQDRTSIVQEFGDCSNNNPGFQQCNKTIIANTAPSDEFSAGYLGFEVENVESCSVSTPSDYLRVEPVPVIERIVPSEYCVDQDVTLTVHGRDFSPYLYSAYMERNGFKFYPPVGALTRPDAGENFSGDNFTIFWDASLASSPSSGFYEMVVNNVNSPANKCQSTSSFAVQVHPKLLVFFVDPPVVYNQISLEVTIYTSGLDATPERVEFLRQGSAEPILVFDNTTIKHPRDDQNKPIYNRIIVRLPKDDGNGQLPVDTYNVRVISRIGCNFIANEILDIVEEAQSDLLTFSPKHLYQGEDSGITVTASANAFEQGPRVYLTPVNASAEDAKAVAVKAVVVRDDKTLTGVVPSGLALGDYDLIVVNLNKTVHVFPVEKRASATIIPSLVPRITSVTPSAAFAGGICEVTGTNLGTTNNGGNTIVLECIDTTGTYKEPIQVSEVTDKVDGNSLTFKIPTLVAGDYCIINLIRKIDGASTKFSSIVIGNAAFKIPPFFPNIENKEVVTGAVGSRGQSLITPRRGAASVMGSVTEASKFIYVFGGDVATGSSIQAVSTVEACELSSIGLCEAFSMQPEELPIPLAFAKAETIGRFIYLVGGQNGTQASTSVYRSYILNPLETAELDVDLRIQPSPNETTVMSNGGLYFYQISAKFDDNDAHNPGGESLPGEVLTVQLPDLSKSGKVTLKLTWTSIPNAIGYFLYRTPSAGKPLSEMRLYQYISSSETSFFDTGDVGLNSTKKPLISGTLGKWHLVADFQTGRWAQGVTHVRNPADPREVLLFSSLGCNHDNPASTGTYPSSYDWCKITEQGPTTPRAAYTQSLTCSTTSVSFTALGDGLNVKGRGFLDAKLIDNNVYTKPELGDTRIVALTYGNDDTTGILEANFLKVDFIAGKFDVSSRDSHTLVSGSKDIGIGGVAVISSNFLYFLFGKEEPYWTATTLNPIKKVGGGVGYIELKHDDTGKFTTDEKTVANVDLYPQTEVAYGTSLVAVGRFYSIGGVVTKTTLDSGENVGQLTGLAQFTTIL